MNPYDLLKLENQLCFPLYAVSKEIIRLYKPYLDPLQLTYTQYITMMALWEHDGINVKALGEKLYLDSGTLTPLLKKLEALGYVSRNRGVDNERNVYITLTDLGWQLRDKAVEVPQKLVAHLELSEDEAQVLYKTLYKLLGQSQGK